MQTTPGLLSVSSSAAAVCLAQKALNSVFGVSKEKGIQITEKKKIKVVFCSSLYDTKGRPHANQTLCSKLEVPFRYFPIYQG